MWAVTKTGRRSEPPGPYGWLLQYSLGGSHRLAAWAVNSSTRVGPALAIPPDYARVSSSTAQAKGEQG